MVIRKARYLPIQKVLSAEVAWEQAAHLLDVVAEIAIRKEDTETLFKVSAMWAEMGLNLGSESETEEGEDGEVHEVGAKSKVGF